MDFWYLVCVTLIIFLGTAYIFFRQYFIKLYYNRIQIKLKSQVKFIDDFSGPMCRVAGADQITIVAGVDISFVLNDPVDACISMVMLDYDSLDVIYSITQWIKLTSEYLPGYLAFREAPHIMALLTHLLGPRSPDRKYYPDVLIVDGNGRLHPKEFGLACHVGVVADIPCIGVAKNLYQMRDIVRDEEHKNLITERLVNAGDFFEIQGEGGVVLGAAVKSCQKSSKPIYVSQGHRVSLETAVKVVVRCSKFRVPEPIRQADMMSREETRYYTENGQKREVGGVIHYKDINRKM